MARYLALNSATYRCDLALSVLYYVSIEVAANLLRTFGVIASALLDLAVSHELGHAICQERDERPADDYRRELHHKTVDCTKTPERETTRYERWISHKTGPAWRFIATTQRTQWTKNLRGPIPYEAYAGTVEVQRTPAGRNGHAAFHVPTAQAHVSRGAKAGDTAGASVVSRQTDTTPLPMKTTG
jgi:hypothetical protein